MNLFPSGFKLGESTRSEKWNRYIGCFTMKYKILNSLLMKINILDIGMKILLLLRQLNNLLFFLIKNNNLKLINPRILIASILSKDIKNIPLIIINTTHQQPTLNNLLKMRYNVLTFKLTNIFNYFNFQAYLTTEEILYIL